MSKPAAIITKLEDCPVWLDQKLVKAYWEAEYLLESLSERVKNPWLFGPGRDLSALELHLLEWKVEQFAIITACNPRSELLPDQENSIRNKKLAEMLQGHCRMMRHSRAQSPEGTWQEPGFWALDIAPERVVKLGRHFEQNAVIFWEKNAGAALWWL